MTRLSLRGPDTRWVEQRCLDHEGLSAPTSIGLDSQNPEIVSRKLGNEATSEQDLVAVSKIEDRS